MNKIFDLPIVEIPSLDQNIFKNLKNKFKKSEICENKPESQVDLHPVIHPWGEMPAIYALNL
jgi:hypothetical protein